VVDGPVYECRVEAQGDPTAHAEMLCIRSAAAKLGGWRLLVLGKRSWPIICTIHMLGRSNSVHWWGLDDCFEQLQDVFLKWSNLMQLWDLHSGCNTVCDSRALPYVCGCHTTSSDRSTCLGSPQFPARSRWQLDQVQWPILFPQIKLLSCEFPVIIKGFSGPDLSC